MYCKDIFAIYWDSIFVIFFFYKQKKKLIINFLKILVIVNNCVAKYICHSLAGRMKIYEAFPRLLRKLQLGPHCSWQNLFVGAEEYLASEESSGFIPLSLSPYSILLVCFRKWFCFVELLLLRCYTKTCTWLHLIWNFFRLNDITIYNTSPLQVTNMKRSLIMQALQVEASRKRTPTTDIWYTIATATMHDLTYFGLSQATVSFIFPSPMLPTAFTDCDLISTAGRYI